MIAGRYEVVKELGQGGMGVVYLVKDIRLQNRLAALKMIHPQLVENPQARQRFEQEVGTCLDLMHPNIVRVHNLDEWQRLQYFTMEYVEGQSLRQLIKERKAKNPPFTLSETVAVITPLLEALSYAHRHTIHRDIKPENMIVTGELPDVQVKVLDFGIAKKTLSPSRFTMTARTLVAVGMRVSPHPPHRSRRAELPHRALASGYDAKAGYWIRVTDSGGGSHW